MKRRDFLRATGAAAVALIVAGPPAHGQDGSQGAVKAVLNPTENPDSQPGWAILNTNAQDELIVQIHLAFALPDTTYAITLKIDGEEKVVGSLTTNGQGNGNTHIVVPLELADSETAVDVKVILDAPVALEAP